MNQSKFVRVKIQESIIAETLLDCENSDNSFILIILESSGYDILADLCDIFQASIERFFFFRNERDEANDVTRQSVLYSEYFAFYESLYSFVNLNFLNAESLLKTIIIPMTMKSRFHLSKSVESFDRDNV